MKALDFLKEQQQRHKNMAQSMDLVYFDDELEEAIAELEALQSRSCEGCKHLLASPRICLKRIQNCDGILPKDFCCNRYEPKLKEQ